MNKQAVDVLELARMLRTAADALEEYHRKDKFNAFVWNTLGISTMRQLIEAYEEQKENEQ